ncbi:hypothetical protein [Pseudomonas sp. FEN]|nr:hypothetical protein [Pseudomonas sp. FEN]
MDQAVFHGENQSRLHAKLFIRKNAFKTIGCVLFLAKAPCILQ